VAQKAWSGRFQAATDRRVDQFTESISFDRRLFAHDIQGSIAHVEMLSEVGLVTGSQCTQIVQALMQIRAEIEEGRFPFEIEKEDIHMHIESALIERLGDVGRLVHTGRSRNDQVSTAARLWTREALDRLDGLLVDLQRAFVELGERHETLIMPGYTHLQRAQPVTAGHYVLAYVEKFERDRARVADARKRLNWSPLGAAALAGTSLPIDRESVARKLGFEGVARNSLDVSSDRDWVIETVFVCGLIAGHLSGWAEEWVLWSTVEFGFLELSQAVCTGSSIMPQKKNPDVCELIRGRAARVLGALVSELALVKGLPLAYNRDLQEDKPALFEACDITAACLEAAAIVVREAEFRGDRIAERLEEGFLDATSLMEYLITRGVPQRTAHHVIGRLVSQCEERGLTRLEELEDEDLRNAHPSLGPEARESLGVARAVARYRSLGSSNPALVAAELKRWRGKLDAAGT
jgi:argininosuccinate lyase